MRHAPDLDTAKLDYQCAVFNVLNYHSLLDMNLGHCIAHLSKPENPESEYTKIEKMSCSAKIDALRKLSRPEMIDSYEIWAKDASRVRAVRNHFAHGVWEYLPMHPSEPVGLRMPPWYAPVDCIKARYSVEEIQSLAQEIQECFEHFMEWRREHAV